VAKSRPVALPRPAGRGAFQFSAREKAPTRPGRSFTFQRGTNPSLARRVALTMRAFAAPVTRCFGGSTNRPVLPASKPLQQPKRRAKKAPLHPTWAAGLSKGVQVMTARILRENSGPIRVVNPPQRSPPVEISFLPASYRSRTESQRSALGASTSARIESQTGI
jgi:hypothetical protein